MVFLLITFVLLHVWLYWCRYVKFYALPNVTKGFQDGIISPVCGTVVYIRHLSRVTKGTDVVFNKLGRKSNLLPIEYDGDWVHIGIYMSPFNNHHIIQPVSNRLVETYDIDGELNPMLSNSDTRWPLTWSKDWFNRKLHQFIAKNKKTMWKYFDPITGKGFTMYMIYDKYVGSMRQVDIDPRELRGRSCLGFVCRGSQMDFVIPLAYYTEVVKVGQSVNFDTLIARGTTC